MLALMAPAEPDGPDWQAVDDAIRQLEQRTAWLRQVAELARREPGRVRPDTAVVQECDRVYDAAVTLATVVGCELGRSR